MSSYRPRHAQPDRVDPLASRSSARARLVYELRTRYHYQVANRIPLGDPWLGEPWPNSPRHLPQPF